MPRLPRFTQKIFGSNAGTNQLAQYGSLAAGTPQRYNGTTITPTIIQSLTQYLNGWFAGVIGLNSPAIEDMNALFYLVTYQLAQILQSGMPEWDSGTTYFIDNIVNYNGILYQSLVDDNLNSTPSPTNTDWKTFGAETITAKFTLEAAIVPFEDISGPHVQSANQLIQKVGLSMMNSGTSGSTTIRINQYRSGVLIDSATASLTAVGGNPASAFPDLSNDLDTEVGDILSCDVVSIAGGAPESLSVEIFGGGIMSAGGGGGGGGGPAPYVYTVTGADITNQGFTLAYTPDDDSRVLIDIQGGPRQFPGLDYSVSGSAVSWASLGLEDIVIAGSKLLITYSS